MTKLRTDRLLLARGLAESRTRARALIEAGMVESDGRRISRPGELLAEDAPLRLVGRDHPWVSRGGIKLDHALEHFGLEVEGLLCLDLGASTGGFTDVLISRGAKRVYAVDVGHGQLHERLRADPRVISMEGVNARYLAADQVPEPIDLLVCDASFISLKRLLPAPLALVKPGGGLVVLIKPQFELSAAAIGKGGVVRDPALHAQACDAVTSWLAQQTGWRVEGVIASPITGPSGNREFLMKASKGRDWINASGPPAPEEDSGADPPPGR